VRSLHIFVESGFEERIVMGSEYIPEQLEFTLALYSDPITATYHAAILFAFCKSVVAKC
jgi:hypothetical protein